MLQSAMKFSLPIILLVIAHQQSQYKVLAKSNLTASSSTTVSNNDQSPSSSSSSATIIDKLIAGDHHHPKSSSKHVAERRKAVTIGLNRWIRPLTIQVPDVLTNLLPSSSNIIKVHDDSPNNKTKTQHDESRYGTTQVPILGYDPMQLLSNFDTSSFAKSIIGDDPRLQPFLSDSIASASNSSLNGQSIANMPSMMIPLSDSPYALSPMLYSQTLLPKAQHYMNYAMGKNPLQHQDQSSLLHSSKSFGNHANHKSRPFNGQSGDGITSNSQMSEHNYGGHPPNKPKQTVGQAIPTNYLLKNTKMFDQQDQFSDQFAYGNHQASTSDDEAKDKMSYYKKLLSSFDDFDKDRSTSSFNELIAKEPIDFNHFNQNGQNGLNFDMNSFNNDEQSYGTKFDQHRSKSSLDYYHQLNFDKESFNDQNFGKGGSDGNDGNDSLQMMMQKPETTRDHGRPTAPFSKYFGSHNPQSQNSGHHSNQNNHHADQQQHHQTQQHQSSNHHHNDHHHHLHHNHHPEQQPHHLHQQSYNHQTFSSDEIQNDPNGLGGIDEEKFMTAASMINPTAIHVLNSSVHKNQYERNRLNENSDQINDMRGFSSSPQISSQPSFLPFVNFEALPSVHFKTNHPRPVASRFKEFFKNMINQKF